MPRTTEITIKFKADLDSVPGWGYETKDWVNLITADFMRQSHYNTSFEVVCIEIKKPIYSGCTPEEYLAATKGA